MDELFGRRPNITPLAQVCLGVPAEEQGEHEESSTVPQRRCGLIMEEKEDEEDEEEDKIAEVDKVDEYKEDEASGNTNYETAQQYQKDINTQGNSSGGNQNVN
ncbi:hypothetical protein BGZ93_003828 [Podila epicladia]|nr:hypothetical protein BGZ92_000537 [Podila epicladia]KAG0096879.1 hypothetical protein BGZ93_003828 [Podila epicladia]